MSPLPQADVIKAIARLVKFYKHESCGQCTPCREGKKQLQHEKETFGRSQLTSNMEQLGRKETGYSGSQEEAGSETGLSNNLIVSKRV